MHAYQVTDAHGNHMQVNADDLDGAQEQFIWTCEARGICHASIVRIVRV